MARRQGNYVLAGDYLSNCLQLYRELGDKVWVAGVLGNLAIVAHIMGKYEEARLFSAESMALRRELGDKTGLAIILGNLASMHREYGEFREARVLLDEALALSREIDNKQRQLHVLAEIGQLMCDQGDYEQAEPLLKKSMELAQSTGEQSHVGGVLTTLGRIALYKEEYALARTWFSEALTSHQQSHEHGVDMAGILEWIALLEVSQASLGDNAYCYKRATILLGATERRRNEMGAPVPPVKQKSQAEAVEALQAQLGKSMFDKAWAEGQTMTVEVALDYAQGKSRANAI
jgi:tetratricopeptide (TPR) repeat protein